MNKILKTLDLVAGVSVGLLNIPGAITIGAIATTLQVAGYAGSDLARRVAKVGHIYNDLLSYSIGVSMKHGAIGSIYYPGADAERNAYGIAWAEAVGEAFPTTVVGSTLKAAASSLRRSQGLTAVPN